MILLPVLSSSSLNFHPTVCTVFTFNSPKSKNHFWFSWLLNGNILYSCVTASLLLMSPSFSSKLLCNESCFSTWVRGGWHIFFLLPSHIPYFFAFYFFIIYFSFFIYRVSKENTMKVVRATKGIMLQTFCLRNPHVWFIWATRVFWDDNSSCHVVLLLLQFPESIGSVYDRNPWWRR